MGEPEIDPDFPEAMDDAARQQFAKACLDAGRIHGVSAHYLIAVANHESGGIKNPPPKGDESSACGPFQITRATWATYGYPLGFADHHRFDPFRQPYVAAKIASDGTDALKDALSDANYPDGRFPTGAELYFSHLFGVNGARSILAASNMSPDGTRPTKIDVALGAIVPAVNVAKIMEGNASLLKPEGTPVSVDELLKKVIDLLAPGLKIAVELIEKVEPGLYAPTQSPTDATTTKWMVLAKQELQKNVRELSDEIIKYSAESGLGPGDRGQTAWCAAFVSWCIKKSTNLNLNYSARAADWLNIGQSSEPMYGAIGVTFPLATDSSGHVGFVVQFDDKRVMLLAGNQTPAGGGPGSVCIREFPMAKMRGFRMVSSGSNPLVVAFHAIRQWFG